MLPHSATTSRRFAPVEDAAAHVPARADRPTSEEVSAHTVGEHDNTTHAAAHVTYYVYAAQCPRARAVAPAAQQQPREMCMNPNNSMQVQEQRRARCDHDATRVPCATRACAHLCMQVGGQQPMRRRPNNPTCQSHPHTCTGHLSAAKRGGATPAQPAEQTEAA